MSFWIHRSTWSRIFLLSIALISLYISAATISTVQAESLYITPDYLQGLDAEVDDPQYLEAARKDLRDSETLEQSQTSSPAEVNKALISRFNFEELLRTKHPSSYDVYTKLSTSARILIYEEFKKTEKLSIAKRLIIERYESGK